MESVEELIERFGLNPFRTGQCLSTKRRMEMGPEDMCLNPFRTEQCLSTYFCCLYLDGEMSQSL